MKHNTQKKRTTQKMKNLFKSYEYGDIDDDTDSLLEDISHPQKIYKPKSEDNQ